MFRIVIVILLNVALSLGCRPPPCHWVDPKPVENYFHQVAQKVINADRNAENYCNKQGSYIEEVHDMTEYKFVIPGADVTTYDIKVRSRVLMIIPATCQNSVTELRILPSYVNGYGGYYTFKNNNLEIVFPYKYNPAVGGGSCEEPNRNIATLSQR